MEPSQKSGLTEYGCSVLNAKQQTRQASVLRNMLNFGGFLFFSAFPEQGEVVP